VVFGLKKKISLQRVKDEGGKKINNIQIQLSAKKKNFQLLGVGRGHSSVVAQWNSKQPKKKKAVNSPQSRPTPRLMGTWGRVQKPQERGTPELLGRKLEDNRVREEGKQNQGREIQSFPLTRMKKKR